MDSKGRFSVPASMRHIVQASSNGQNRLCLTKHEEYPCVIGFGHSYQQALRANIDHEEQLALARGEGYNRAAAMQRKFGLLEDVPFDDGGRFFISPFLKKLRSEEHTSETQSLMRISYAVFCLKKKKTKITTKHT